MDHYDEDLFENVFFQTLQKKFAPLFDEATSKRWMVCHCFHFLTFLLTNTVMLKRGCLHELLVVPGGTVQIYQPMNDQSRQMLMQLTSMIVWYWL